MKVTIIGTGGVGAYFGGRMAKAGHDVTFVARGEHLKTMLEKGLQVKSINGDFLVSPVKATSEIAKTGVADLVIVAVKAWQLKEVAMQLKNVVGENTLVLPLQNGVLASEELKEVLPHKNVLAGLCRIISKIENSGIINHLAVEPTIVFGEADNSKTDRVLELNSIFEASGFKSMVAKDIQSELWKKFISICVSALLAVTRSTYGEVREQPETREMMYRLFKEVADVAAAMNVYIKEDFVDKTMGFIDTFPYDSTSSLTRDIWEGKPSELEYQNGTVVRLAERAGVDVPVNRFIYHSLILMEKRARS
ncbi:ketopantoate reductase family protein [Natronoflexus pectinivorans]|uniref:2-dehydropantoate 2-reductase n=1 Tax=Natronoflexus pectinivorans TaxID=682526 RepID=A0A4R2GKG2_9BACT|nr:2-dehydropantoate 2-reductase [Natronoflexus pectinivorans]TCO08706.1 2-dehydropantoate 2-reductase [Natronoflexus pectinivorans]